MSERGLSKSYGLIQKWESTDGPTQKWIRWDFATPKEKWLEKNKLTEKWLRENLKWMIKGGDITSIQRANDHRLYYIVTTEKGEEYCLVFELTRGVNSLVLIFKDHYQSYNFRTKSHRPDFSFEAYDCFQNGMAEISFSHSSTSVSTIIIGGKIDLIFSVKQNLPVFKLLNEYNSIFREISKYNSNCIGPFDQKSYIEAVTQIARMCKMNISEEVTRVRVIFDHNKEWFDFDSDGQSMKARLCEGGNYVICHKDGRTEWLGQHSINCKSYRIRDGVIVDSKGEKVTDQKLLKTIISEIREAKSLFYRMKQEFLAD